MKAVTPVGVWKYEGQERGEVVIVSMFLVMVAVVVIASSMLSVVETVVLK